MCNRMSFPNYILRSNHKQITVDQALFSKEVGPLSNRSRPRKTLKSQQRLVVEVRKQCFAYKYIKRTINKLKRAFHDNPSQPQSASDQALRYNKQIGIDALGSSGIFFTKFVFRGLHVKYVSPPLVPMTLPQAHWLKICTFEYVSPQFPKHELMK